MEEKLKKLKSLLAEIANLDAANADFELGSTGKHARWSG